MRPSRLRRWLGATLLLLCAALPGRAAAQDPAYTITGSVLDAESRAPLANVNVELRTGAQASNTRTVTDGNSIDRVLRRSLAVARQFWDRSPVDRHPP